RVLRDLPEGVLGDVNEQMRGPVSSGHVAEGLLLGVQKLVTALAGKLGFNTEGMNQPPTAQASPPLPSGAPGKTADRTASTGPTTAPIEEPTPAAIPAQAAAEDKSPAAR